MVPCISMPNQYGQRACLFTWPSCWLEMLRGERRRERSIEALLGISSFLGHRRTAPDGHCGPAEWGGDMIEL